MLKRTYYVVTGTIHMEGGQRVRARSRGKGKKKVVVTQERHVTDDRHDAHVIVTRYNKRLEKLQIMKTPYGRLFAATERPAIQAMIADAARDANEFNQGAKTCFLRNFLLLERLRGPRLQAVENWMILSAGDDPVKAFMKEDRTAAAAA